MNDGYNSDVKYSIICRIKQIGQRQVQSDREKQKSMQKLIQIILNPGRETTWQNKDTETNA